MLKSFFLVYFYFEMAKSFTNKCKHLSAYGGSVDSTVPVDSPVERGLSAEFACSAHACISLLHHQKHAQINKLLQWLWHCPKPELSLWLHTTFCVLDCVPVQMKCRSLCYDQFVCLLVRSTPHLSVPLKNRFQWSFSCKSSSSICFCVFFLT